MLVLSRQRDETIMIGDDIEITIVDIRGDKVRLGINAPREVQVHRKEVYEAIRRENAEASQVRVDDLPTLDRNAKRIDPRSEPRSEPRIDPRSDLRSEPRSEPRIDAPPRNGQGGPKQA